MPKKCFICSHKNRCQIDELILNKTPYSTIAHQFKLPGKDPTQVIKNHVRYGHIPKEIKSAAIEKQTEIGLNVAGCAQEIYDICLRAAKKAETHDLRALGSCIAPAVKVLEILSKGNPDKPDGEKKDSVFMAGYMSRASKVYAETESPPPQ